MKTGHWHRLTGCMAVLITAAVSAEIPAFPDAEGFGAYAAGGRGGDVYYVDNLRRSGPGSFADAIATVPPEGRTILFKVSGYIPVNKTNLKRSKVTIAGQSAPGDGIGFKGGSFFVNGDDIIIRHVRFRYGDQKAGGDCIDIGNGVTNVIFDHVSVEFSTDENFSSFERNPRPDLVTFQWALNAWGLEPHSCGGLWDVERVTTHHTLWAHNHTRNPKARPYGLLDWINNVTFDWDIGFIMGDSSTPADWSANVRGCYFICPPGNIRSHALEKARKDREGKPNFTLFAGNNLFDNNGNAILDGTNCGYGIASGDYRVAPQPLVKGLPKPVSIDPPLTAYKKIVSSAGALRLDARASTPLRDEVDAVLIHDLVTLKRGHITNEIQTGVGDGGMGVLKSAVPPDDSDQDGMPDYWERTLGSDVNADDHNAPVVAGAFLPHQPAGYTLLEEYLHFLALPHAVLQKDASMNHPSLNVDLRRYTSGFTHAPVFKLSGVAGGTATQSGPGDCLVRFVPSPDRVGRAHFDFEVRDADGSAWRQTFAMIVSVEALQGSGQIEQGTHEQSSK